MYSTLYEIPTILNPLTFPLKNKNDPPWSALLRGVVGSVAIIIVLSFMLVKEDQSQINYQVS
jgi:hypothetical protein